MSDYRFPGLQPFHQDDANLFKGRVNEIRELTDMILQEKVVVVFSKSGLGKTSLLNAGVMPQLEPKGFIPVPIRFSYGENLMSHSGGTTKGPVKTSLETLFCRQLLDCYQQYNPSLQPLILTPDMTMWELLKHAEFTGTDGEKRMPVLLFDQFEEAFTLYPNASDRERFVEQFADVCNGVMPDALRQQLMQQAATGAINRQDLLWWGNEPAYKVVIAIRSDLLHHLDDLSHRIPFIYRVRYQVLPLKRAEARQAILEPAAMTGNFRCPPFSFETAQTLPNLLDTLCGEHSDEVEAFQLQVLCRYVEDEIVKQKLSPPIEIEESFYDGKEGIKKILENYYLNEVHDLNKEWEDTAHKLIEEGLIFNGRRISMEENVLLAQYKIPPDQLQRLVDRRLLRKEARMGSFYYEISHDTLVQPILTAYERRRTIEEEQQREQEELERDRQMREQAEKLREERRRLAALVRANKRTWLALTIAIILFALVLAVGYSSLQQEIENDRKLGESYFKSEQYAEAKKIYAQINRGWIKPFLTSPPHDTFLRKLDNLEQWKETFENLKAEGDSLTIAGKQQVALLKYYEAKQTLQFSHRENHKKEIQTRIDQTRAFLINDYKDRAETFFKGNFCNEACHYWNKLRELNPENVELKSQATTCNCQ